jgi:UDP-4-amino-4,6-dideoxy-N-acetyl-beta-L-altrosamine transaminase
MNGLKIIRIKLEKSEFIPYGRQDITEKDVESVVQVLRSDFLTQGPAVPAFEQKLCDYTGVKHTVAVNSCTSALHIACLALDLGLGDILWTSSITFVASANCALYCGATIDFVDIDPDTALMDTRKLKKKLEKAEKEGKLPKIVVPVHFAGQPCDMKEIYDLSRQYHFKIIEDAAHAIGAKYHGKPVGNCQYSDITVFSFHPVKIITTGEGGAALTNDAKLTEKMSIFRSHGITRNPKNMTRKPDGPWYYEQISLGYNYRMTDIQAALGSSQLNRLDEYISKRLDIAHKYDNFFKNIEIDPLVQKESRQSSYHLYVVRVGQGKLQRNKLFDELIEAGIGVNIHYMPVHKQPYFSYEEELICAENYYNETITIPLYPNLDNTKFNQIIDSITLSIC